MKILRMLVALVALLLAGPALAQQKPCSKNDAAAAEKAIERVTCWPMLQKAWQDYKHCDAGPIDELYTDALLRLAVDWKDVSTFAAAVEKDEQYKEFVYRHLKSPAAKDDLDAVYSRAKASCPPKLDKFCADLVEVSRPALAPLPRPTTTMTPASTPAAPTPAPTPTPAPPAK